MWHQRPKPGETDDELVSQDKEFKAKLYNEEIHPSTKLIQTDKRKTDVYNTAQDSSLRLEATERPALKLTESFFKKKKKSLADNTILGEPDSTKEEKSSVLGSVIEKSVPSLSSLMKQWNPQLNPQGFPQVPHLSLSDTKKPNVSKELDISKRKSLYMRQIEKIKGTTTLHNKNPHNSINCTNPLDEKLTALGDKSYVIDGKSSLNEVEAAKIHQENMRRLSQISHEERLSQRNELMSNLTNDQLMFLKLFRKRKQSQGICPNKTTKMKSDTIKVNVTPFMSDEPRDPVVCNPNSSNQFRAEESHMDIPFSELPIPLKEAKKWVHMDQIELNKMKWMTEIPTPKSLESKEGYIARFDFEGSLLPYDSDISWRQGLHHHGDEPGRAGYTLEELFIFVRSRIVQQRHLGLKILANILRNANEGLYDNCFETSVMELMIDGGLIIILRFSIDESTALVYQEALRALYFLISNEPDERCLSIAEPCIPLGIHPGISSLTNSREKDREELKAEENELKDVDVIKLDVIRALLRMDILLRLRYMLESLSLSPSDVIHILGILKRFARHSLTSAWTLINTPRLLTTIIDNFLPHNTTSLLCGKNRNQLMTVYGIPLSHALSLMKVLANRGREISVRLVKDYNLMSRLMAYISFEPTEIVMPLAEVLRLSQEAYFLWSIFLSYGLEKSVVAFSTFYPLLLKQLIFYRDKLDLNANMESNQFNYEIAAHIGNVLTKGLCVASTRSLLLNRMKNSESSVNIANREDLILPPPSLAWGDFGEILPLVEICLTKWINQMSSCLNVSFSGFKLLGSFCHFLDTYLGKWRDQNCFESVGFAKKIEFILQGILGPILKKDVVSFLLTKLRKYSAFCSTLKAGKNRVPANLGSLCSICEEGSVIPIVHKDSAFLFLFPLTSLLRTIYTLHPNLDAEFIFTILNAKHLENYFSDVCSSQHLLSSQWFSRIEIYTVVNLLQLASLKGCNNHIMYHKVALTILPHIHKGDEHLVQSLLSDVVCNVNFAKDLVEISSQVNTLSLTEYTCLKSPTMVQPSLSPLELTSKLYRSLPYIGQNMVKNVMHTAHLNDSLIKYNCIPFLINDLTLDLLEEISILDHYWPLLPLKLLLRLNGPCNEYSNQSSEETILLVVHSLQMTFFLLKFRKDVIMPHGTHMRWYMYLSNVYLVSNDIFLDVNVSSYNQASLISILTEGGYHELNYVPSFPDFQPCYDWYKRMIEHFVGVSYGDSSFALFIIIPLMGNWPSEYKLLLFGEHEDALPFIRLTIEDVSQFIPLEKFLSPLEENPNVILKYKMAFAQHRISENRTPFLCHFITHHIKYSQMMKKNESNT